MTTFPTNMTPVRSYSGAKGCMCGCKGNYSDSPAQVARAYKSLQKRVAAGDCDDFGFDDGNGFATCAWVNWTTPAGNARTAVVYFDK